MSKRSVLDTITWKDFILSTENKRNAETEIFKTDQYSSSSAMQFRLRQKKVHGIGIVFQPAVHTLCTWGKIGQPNDQKI